MTPESRFVERVYSRLLFLYSRPFRDAYGSDMLQTFSTSLRAARASGQSSRFLRSPLSDLVHTALAERVFFRSVAGSTGARP
ncbi:MAG TPA: hypothetical protein VFB58_01700 [Chloroflexota bacterium]|nr:hypothetical protein [Chloroflexota bacterium]